MPWDYRLILAKEGGLQNLIFIFYFYDCHGCKMNKELQWNKDRVRKKIRLGHICKILKVKVYKRILKADKGSRESMLINSPT